MADPPIPSGFVEPIMQWGVQKGQTCEDIAKVVYGSATHVPLIGRYNRVVCAKGQSLQEGITLILPAKVTNVPDARVATSHPDVRGRPSGGSWATVTSGAPLYRNHNLQTMDEGRAKIEFLDHTYVFLAQNTLIVVYGTASKTRVSKVTPTIELQAGEVQAGLSALRGEPALVALPEGGQVTATSRDTIVERKAARTTIAVFEGKVSVESGGKTVAVPKNFGTRFVGTAPPAPPRPLPPAPRWQAGGYPSLVMAPDRQSVFSMQWAAVEKARAYRFEIARDEGFHDLAQRIEVPADTLTFRAEGFPAATYYVRVRAIDTEDYLGIASEVRRVEVVTAEVRGEGSRLEQGRLVANPYGIIQFDPKSGLQLAINDGPFGPVPKELDLLLQAPKSFRLRSPSGNIENIAVEYMAVKANPQASFDPEKRALNFVVKFDGTKDLDVEKRIGPRLRLQIGGKTETLPLALQPDKTMVAAYPVGDSSGEVHFEVMDQRGLALGTNSFLVPEKAAPPPPPAVPLRRIGLKLPPVRPAGVTGLAWASPTLPMAAGIGIGAGITANGFVVQGNVRASGAIGGWGFEAMVASPPYEENAYPTNAEYPPTENMAWFGVRHRFIRQGNAAFELAPYARLGVPMVLQGQPFRIDLGAAIGGAPSDRASWLVNAGIPFVLGETTSFVPQFSPYLVAGGTFQPIDWLRAFAAANVQVMMLSDGRNIVPYGLTGGVEVGRSVFFSLSGWIGRGESIEPTFAGTGMLSLGLHLTEVTP